MGNSDSTPTNKYIVKKKVRAPVQDELAKKVNFKDQSQTQGSKHQKLKQQENKLNNTQFLNNNDINNRSFEKPPKINLDPRAEIQQRSSTIHHNDALIERNMMTDIYNRNRSTMDYPTSSNSEIGYMKKNTEKIEFTPFNINDEVGKFKKSLKNEREEEERRRIL